MCTEIVLATQNQGKITEMERILSPVTSLTLIPLSHTGFTGEIIENGNSFSENALIKARAVHDFTEAAVLADDSGLCVDALDGAPGIFSARYKGLNSDIERCDALLLSLDHIPRVERSASFICVVAYIDLAGSEYLFEGQCRGHIAEKTTGTQGFGYDPIFIPSGHECTMAELSADEKNRISHRADALRTFSRHIRVDE